jgi:hypothetical protein
MHSLEAVYNREEGLSIVGGTLKSEPMREADAKAAELQRRKFGLRIAQFCMQTGTEIT